MAEKVGTRWKAAVAVVIAAASMVAAVTPVAGVPVSAQDASPPPSGSEPLAAPTPPDGPIARYDFIEGSGTTVFDKSGISPALDLTITRPAGASWVPGGGLRLNGSTGLATSDAAARVTAAVQSSGEVTLEAWVTPDAAKPAGPGVVVALGSSATRRSVALTQGYWNSGPTDRFEGMLRSSSKYGRLASTQGSVAPAAMTHLVLRRTDSGRFSLWIDGDKVVDRASPRSLSDWGGDFPLVVGADRDGSRGFRGTVHMVKVYARDLTDLEILRKLRAGPGGVEDETPPVIERPQIVAASTALDVTIRTNEPTSVAVAVSGGGVDRSVGSATPSTTHVVTIDRLTPDTPYTLRITATDTSGNSTTTTATARTAPPAVINTVIDVWYGPTQQFGPRGVPQRWVNVHGRASDPDGLESASFRLNGGPAQPLSLGSDDRRLVGPGDFNVELFVGDLDLGPNSVQIRVLDRLGNLATTTVTVDWRPGVITTSPYVIDWGAVAAVGDAVQVVDGNWTVNPASSAVRVTPGHAGYDRLLAIGDTSWVNYDVRTSVTIHEIMEDLGPFSAAPGFGFLAHWNGHNDSVAPGSQPHQGFRPDASGDPTPFGALAWWRDGVVRIQNHRVKIADAGEAFPVVEGETYEVRLNVTKSGKQVRFRIKLWNAGSPEPESWQADWVSRGQFDEPGKGSVVLVAHEIELSFGDVTVSAP